MKNGGMVSVPARKAPDAGGNSDIAKTGKAIKGFGGGSAGNLKPSTVTAGATKSSIKGFSGSGVKGGKI